MKIALYISGQCSVRCHGYDPAALADNIASVSHHYTVAIIIILLILFYKCFRKYFCF